MRKIKTNPTERLPWYRDTNYDGDLTEIEKRQLDAFRSQPKHPATLKKDLPEEVRDYINEIELGIYDCKQQDIAAKALFYSFIGAALIGIHYTGCFMATLTPWIYVFDVLILVLPWFSYKSRWQKNADDLFSDKDEPIRKVWELNYVVALKMQQRKTASDDG